MAFVQRLGWINAIATGMAWTLMAVGVGGVAFAGTGMPRPATQSAMQKAAPAKKESPAATTSGRHAGQNPGQAASGGASALAGLAPAATMSARQFLAQRLGKRFHPRADWAGTDKAFRPKLRPYREWLPIGQVRYLTIHHSDDVPNLPPYRMIRNVFRGHTTAHGRLDAADIGYHFFVDRNGEVWEGRDAAIMGTHVGSRPHGLNNVGNVGICGLGNFTHKDPPQAMVDGVVELSRLLCQYYGRPLVARGHKDWIGIGWPYRLGGTDCPGRLEKAVDLARLAIVKDFAAATTGLSGKVAATTAPQLQGSPKAGGAAGAFSPQSQVANATKLATPATASVTNKAKAPVPAPNARRGGASASVAGAERPNPS
jgi:hypothetical protein